MAKHRSVVVELLSERLVKAFGLFVGTWLVGACGFWVIGQSYGVNDSLVLPDGSLDHANYSFLNCLYLAAMAVSTLGFADMAMLNRIPGEGRDVAYSFMIFFALTSYLVVVYATAQIVSYVVEGALGRYLEKRRMQRDLERISHHYVVCGLGMTGHHIVHELVKVEAAVVGFDIDPVLVERCRKDFPDGVFFDGDCTHEEDLIKAGVQRAAGVFCAVGADKDNIISALTARQLNPEARIVSRAEDLRNVGKLKQVGSSATISPNHIGGLRMASEMLRPSVVTFLDTMLRSSNATTRFENVQVRPGATAAGRALKDLEVYEKTGLLVVAMVKGGGEIVYNPSPGIVIQGGDAVVVIASPAQKLALEAYLNG